MAAPPAQKLATIWAVTSCGQGVTPAATTPWSPANTATAASARWTQTLDGALQLDFDTVIPGHGPVTNKAGLLAYRNNVEKLRNRAADLIHEGKSQEEVGKVMMAEFGWGANSMQMQWSLPGMMTELK